MNREENLTKIAKEVRKKVLEMAFRAKSAHTGGSLSCVDIMVVLYFHIMKNNPKNPNAANRDRLIFSKAHDCKTLYATLAQRGFFDEKLLHEFETDGGRLPGHSTRHAVPGIEVSAGSLGHGLPLAAGMAFAAKKDNKKHRVFAILSDGECDEGSTWEAILFAAHHKLDNLTVIVDYNKLQSFGRTKDVLNLDPFTDKWKSFNWEAKEVNGHDMAALMKILAKLPMKKGKPSVVVAHTIKGFGGVSKHINQISSHYKPPTEEEYEQIMKKYNI